MPKKSILKIDFVAEVKKRIKTPAKLKDWLDGHFPWIVGPSITDFTPASGQPGCLVTITGHNFAAQRWDNIVQVGNQAALVVSATAGELKVITAGDVSDGPVTVTIGANTAMGPRDFHVLGYPSAGAGEDGPPVSYAGAGSGAAGDVNPIGDVRVLVALVRPGDLTPSGSGPRDTVAAAWENVRKFYDQASYGRTKVKVDIMTNWAVLDGTADDFLDDKGPDNQNVEQSQLNRIAAQAAQAAVNEGFKLKDYSMFATVIFLNGAFIRAWGGGSQQNFTYNNSKPPGDPNRIDINLDAQHQLNTITIQETANWGRCAHEFGHNVVTSPSFSGDGTATLGEDIYSSDLVDPAAASAREFDIMGKHDLHPLFSGFHLEKLGYYAKVNPGDVDNIIERQWDRNPHTEEIEVVAHGLSKNTTSGRAHIVKIKVAAGLAYYIQVRQRPGATMQIFDENIPIPGAANMGGVIVTRVISDTLQVNQQTRFITLLHDERVLKKNQTAEDPARALKITVVDDNVQARPQVCKVKIEWAQTIGDTPGGTFDLNVEPWDSDYQSPDVWVDRAPFGTFDNANDSEGRPKGNGDKPRPLEVNHFHARIHVSGADAASNVKATFYAIFPPGVGDNGNWAPIGFQDIGSISANSFSDVFCNWTPAVGKHTCLQIFVSQQLGEVSGGNNFAQENVSEFESPASSPGTPVFIRTAIRNPLKERRMVSLAVVGVPFGWRVYFPHSWVWLDAKAEKEFDLIVIPEFDYFVYQERKLPNVANIRIRGMLPRQYDELLAPFNKPAGSRFYPIGGTYSRVRLVRKSSIRWEEDRDAGGKNGIAFRGKIVPVAAKQRIRAELVDPKGRLRVAEVKTDAAGEFRVKFDLSYEPSLEADRKLWKKSGAAVPGVYRAQAFLFNADQAAEAESNILFITR